MPVACIRVERDVGEDADLGHRCLDRPAGARRRGFPGSAPRRRARRGAPDRYRETARSPGCRAPPRARRRAPPRRRRGARRPGIEATGCRPLAPSIRKSGQMRSSVESRFSRTSRRVQSALRLRRGRCVSESGSASAGAGRGKGDTRAMGLEVARRQPSQKEAARSAAGARGVDRAPSGRLSPSARSPAMSEPELSSERPGAAAPPVS